MVQVWARTARGATKRERGHFLGLSYEKRSLQPHLRWAAIKPNTELGNVNTLGLPPGIWCLRAGRWPVGGRYRCPQPRSSRLFIIRLGKYPCAFPTPS
jgi:hypothetical protein